MPSVVLGVTLAFLLLGGGTDAQQTQPTTAQCPDGWLSWLPQFCYLFVNSSTVTWDQARQECQDQNAHLLRIETEDEYNFLRKTWEGVPGAIPNSDMYWTALNNLPMNEGASTDPDWIWGNDEFPLKTVVQDHWDQEPDQTGYKTCALINVQGAFSMAECTDRKAYICQYKLALHEACPMDWSIGYSRQYCYKVSNVTNWSARLSWTQARKMCEGNPNNKTKLLTVTSMDMQNFLVGILGQVANRRMGFWTGLNYQGGKFLWAGNEGSPYSAFEGMWRKEPNNLGGNEHCGSFLPKGRWNDRNCEDRLNYACRMSLDTASSEMNFGCGGWTRAGKKCVHMFSTRKTWSDARKFCQSAKGDLLSFDDETDADWLTIQALNSMQWRRRPGFWIGLNDIKTEGTYLWADGSEPAGYLLYWDQEPNNNQECSTMNDGGFFADFDCSHVHAGTICEEATKSCAQGWTPFGDHCYQVDTTWKTRNEASAFCSRTSATRKGRLLALNTAQEKAWILKQLPKPLTPKVPHRFWSGLINHGGWMWENEADRDANATQTLVNWSLEPNNRGGNEDCVEILANGNLNDAMCEQTRGFICQRTPNGLPSAGSAPETHFSAIFISILAPVLCKLLLQ
ncbi:C-type mannose receptor 2-like [Babylonia areolata]|uniref:C-type mannose receptor 2-like n=1 Tax=Babylonia areolata TaxID=304850 RepID=UPI003FD057A9